MYVYIYLYWYIMAMCFHSNMYFWRGSIEMCIVILFNNKCLNEKIYTYIYIYIRINMYAEKPVSESWRIQPNLNCVILDCQLFRFIWFLINRKSWRSKFWFNLKIFKYRFLCVYIRTIRPKSRPHSVILILYSVIYA